MSPYSPLSVAVSCQVCARAKNGTLFFDVFTSLCLVCLSGAERLHPSPHCGQKEPNRHCDSAPELRRRKQRPDQTGRHATPLGFGGGPRRHGCAAPE